MFWKHGMAADNRSKLSHENRIEIHFGSYNLLARLSKAKSTTHDFAQTIMKNFLNRKLTTELVSA